MDEPNHGNTTRSGGGILCKLACLTTVLAITYPLSLSPALKLCMDHPSVGRYIPLETLYAPIIHHVQRHPYGYADRFYFWYNRTVWHIPVVRD